MHGAAQTRGGVVPGPGVLFRKIEAWKDPHSHPSSGPCPDEAFRTGKVHHDFSITLTETARLGAPEGCRVDGSFAIFKFAFLGEASPSLELLMSRFAYFVFNFHQG